MITMANLRTQLNDMLNTGETSYDVVPLAKRLARDYDLVGERPTETLASIDVDNWNSIIDMHVIHDDPIVSDFDAALAAASHIVQSTFRHLKHHDTHDTDPAELLRMATREPLHFAAPDAAMWTDAEIVEILTRAAEVDKVTGRAIGFGEIILLEQRDMIRKGLPQR